jgi:hypothetical protein
LVKSRHCVDGQVAAVATATLGAVAQRCNVGVARRTREAEAVVNHVVALAARAIPALDSRAAIDVSAAGDVGVDMARLSPSVATVDGAEFATHALASTHAALGHVCTVDGDKQNVVSVDGLEPLKHAPVPSQRPMRGDAP